MNNKEYQSKYYQKRKEELKEYKKQYNKFYYNQPHIKEKLQKHYEENKEEFRIKQRKYSKKYYNNNKVKILAYMKNLTPEQVKRKRYINKINSRKYRYEQKIKKQTGTIPYDLEKLLIEKGSILLVSDEVNNLIKKAYLEGMKQAKQLLKITNAKDYEN
jgi:hypothetical protein